MKTITGARILLLAALIVLSGLFPAAAASSDTGMLVPRLIIGLQGQPAAEGLAEERVSALAVRRQLQLKDSRRLAPVLHVLELEEPLAGKALADAMAALAADPEVLFVEPDIRLRRHAVPNDPHYAGQWHLQSGQPAAVDFETAWDQTTGSSGVVVAVVDSGIRFDHPDLGRAANGGRLLPGYDFVSGDGDGRYRIANDGDGWDPDPSDPGDWVSEADLRHPVFGDCEADDSSWHGTRVSGLIGAATNNGVGIAGGTWQTWILPVRVLGKCGGWISDILQGMRWAAGLHVDRVPRNPYPAQIINLSIGLEGSCRSDFRAVINEVMDRGALVVASAGNSGDPVHMPANCDGVVAVGGLDHLGNKAEYSSLGPEVSVAVPGGNCSSLYGPCNHALHTTFDSGTTRPAQPAYTDPLQPNVGTSFSAAQVSAIAALMLSVNGHLGPVQLLERLQASARPFRAASGLPICRVPASDHDLQLRECHCTTSTCGAGMAHAPSAVAEALRPIAVLKLPVAVSPGQDLSLDASASVAACGHSIDSFSWRSPDDESVAISGADTAVAIVSVPAAGTLRLELVVTDDAGREDMAEVIVGSRRVSSAAPARVSGEACPSPITPRASSSSVSSDGGGGGGALGGHGLVLLLGSAFLRRRQAIGMV